MKFWKKGLALATSLLMLASVAACGGGSDTQSSASSETSAASSEVASEVATSEAATEAASEAPAESAEANAASDQTYSIGIVQIIDHPALNAARDGFKERLTELGVNCDFDEKNAQGDKSNLQTITQGFVSGKSDLILAIATDAAISAASETSEIPILGTAITDYPAANLVESNEVPGGNVSGTSDMNPVKEQLDLLQEMLPDAKTVGFIYSSAEANSVVQIDAAKAECDARGLKYDEMTIASVNDIQQAATALVGKVDAIYVPTDNLIASAMPNLASVCEPAKLPIICAEPGMVESGGTATVGISYNSLGRQTADMAKRILVDGEDISTMPIEFQKEYEFVFNQESLDAMGLTLTPELLAKAATE